MARKKSDLSGIRLIADRLNISTATVSRALRKETSHMVKEDTRQQIMDLADELRYTPNPGARLIQKGVNPVLGIVIPRAEDVFFSEFYGGFLGGVLHAVQDIEWEIRIIVLRTTSEDLLDQVRRASLDCAGIIYVGNPLGDADLKKLESFRRPMALIKSVLPLDYKPKQHNWHIVGVDNYNGAHTAAQYMVQLGHKKIGLVMGPEDSIDFAERRRGYLDGLKTAGQEIEDDMIFTGSYDHQSGRDACKHFLAMKDRPSAFVCSSDNLAFGVLDYAKEQGLSCPKDLSIIGFDDGPWAQSCSPKLTTMHQPIMELAERSVNAVIRSVDATEKQYLEYIELPVTLNIRESTSNYLAR